MDSMRRRRTVVIAGVVLLLCGLIAAFRGGPPDEVPAYEFLKGARLVKQTREPVELGGTVRWFYDVPRPFAAVSDAALKEILKRGGEELMHPRSSLSLRDDKLSLHMQSGKLIHPAQPRGLPYDPTPKYFYPSAQYIDYSWDPKRCDSTYVLVSARDNRYLVGTLARLNRKLGYPLR